MDFDVQVFLTIALGNTSGRCLMICFWTVGVVLRTIYARLCGCFIYYVEPEIKCREEMISYQLSGD